MAPKHHIPPLILIFPLLLLSLNQWSSCASTPHQEYEKWLMWNHKNHHTRNTHSNQFLDRISDSKVDATIVSGSVTSTRTLEVKLAIAERNKTKLVVDPCGCGDYKTITEAIASIPLHNTRRFILEIKPGVYREKIHIPKTKGFITMVGDANNPPTITGNDTAKLTGADGSPLRTFQSATVAVDADYFIAINIIFENTAPHQAGGIGEQAVALRISGTKAAFYSCSFYGFQDTLYDHKGLHYFRDCFIQGSVDFIFGHARSLYENCTLKSISRNVASVTAQKRTNSSLESGFSFKNSMVTGSGLVYLGRAWGDYSRVVFSFTFMDKVVLPQGWNNWGNPKRSLSVYYGEYKCSGPGSNMTGRVPWARALTDQEAEPFLGPSFVEGDSWLISPTI